MEQDEIIRRFVAVYNQSQSAEYQITRWPDKENRQSRDCDTYAEAPGMRPIAIEHYYIKCKLALVLRGNQVPFDPPASPPLLEWDKKVKPDHFLGKFPLSPYSPKPVFVKPCGNDRLALEVTHGIEVAL